MKRLFSNWWVLTVSAAALVALVLTLALPIVAPPLRPWWARLVLALVVLLVWGGFALWRVARGRRASDAIAGEIAKPEAKAGPDDSESRALADRLRQALGQAKSAGGGKRDYLYSRPWYVIIGPPGAGKTTALLNSGLRFPFSDTALKGVGGTRNLDFWFAEDAVLVDTAGRYTTQDSDAPADAEAWQSFLDLLRKNRPLQPINGVLVAIGLDELLRADRAAIDAHAGAVRRRLAELRKTLEVSAPVYVLLTKADLLAGFADFFEDLDVEGRRAVLGATLADPDTTAGPGALAAAFDRFAQRVADREPKRLQDDSDARRRGLILGFPSQLAALRPRVLRFLDGVFPAEGDAPARLRGFYLTSGVQQGAPLDRLLSGVAQVFDTPQTPPREGRGRAYFLNRLLGEVVFPEAGLVQSDAKARARRTGGMVGGLVALGLVSLVVALLWLASFLNNRNLQQRLLAGGQGVQQEVRAGSLDLVEVRESDPDLEQTLSVLRSLRDLPRGYAERRKGAGPFLAHLGLYQDALSRQAEEAYLNALQRIMLPRVLLRMERYLQDHQREPLALYEPLKAYLMLGGQGPLDPRAAKAWIERDWEESVFPGADRAGVRKELSAHLDALLADGQLGRAWPDRAAPLDGALIASSRAAVQTMSLADRAYAVLKQKALSADAAPWRADQVLTSGDAQAFGNGAQITTLTVPAFFTRQGFERDYQLGLQTVQADLERDLWVLGADVDKSSIKGQLGGIRPGVASLYAKDYIAAWDKVAKAPQPADYFGDPAAFGAFTRQPSPLKLLLLEVRKNTALSGPGAIGGAVAAAQKKLAALPGASLAGAGAMSAGVDAGKQIADYFQALNTYVGDGKGSAPIDDFVTAVKNTGSANAAARVAGGGAGGASAQGQLATALGSVAASGAGAPPALQAFVAQATQGGTKAVATSQHGAIADEYGRNLAPSCHGAVDNRYPFFGASQNDATVADLLRVFGLNGQFDGFARDRLAPLLETSAPIWRWKPDQPVAAALDPTSAAELQKAAELRDVLTSGVPIKVEGQGFGGAVTAAEFSSGGVSYRFEATTVGAKPVTWSTQAGAPEAHVALFAGAQEVKRYSFEGPWALFRLFDAARKENAGPTAFKATFGEGATFAVFKIGLPSQKNPFSRGGLWSFRCPAKL